MSRRKMTEAEKLARQAEKLGIDLSDIHIPTKDIIDTEDDKALEAEAVLLYFDLKGKGFTHQLCPECGRPFAYKYSYKTKGMHCSNRCRKAGLDKRGVPWNPGKSLEARWAASNTKGTIPLIVPPESLLALSADLLGKHVLVTLDETTNQTVAYSGILMTIEASGGFAIRSDEDNQIMFGWPALRIEEI